MRRKKFGDTYLSVSSGNLTTYRVSNFQIGDVEDDEFSYPFRADLFNLISLLNHRQSNKPPRQAIPTFHHHNIDDRFASIHNITTSHIGIPIKEYLNSAKMSEIDDGQRIANVLTILSDVSTGLALLHEQKYSHNYFSPNAVRVLDFDSTAPWGQLSYILMPTGLKTTSIHLPKYNRDYMSPELYRCNILDWKSDLYSLGIVLYELVEKRRPRPPDDFCSDIQFVVLEEFAGNEGSEKLKRFIRSCLKEDPSDRANGMDNMRSVANHLHVILADWPAPKKDAEPSLESSEAPSPINRDPHLKHIGKPGEIVYSIAEFLHGQPIEFEPEGKRELKLSYVLNNHHKNVVGSNFKVDIQSPLDSQSTHIPRNNKPDSWEVEFLPEKLELVPSHAIEGENLKNSSQRLFLKPPFSSKTPTGIYQCHLSADFSDNTPTTFTQTGGSFDIFLRPKLKWDCNIVPVKLKWFSQKPVEEDRPKSKWFKQALSIHCKNTGNVALDFLIIISEKSPNSNNPLTFSKVDSEDSPKKPELPEATSTLLKGKVNKNSIDEVSNKIKNLKSSSIHTIPNRFKNLTTQFKRRRSTRETTLTLGPISSLAPGDTVTRVFIVHRNVRIRSRNVASVIVEIKSIDEGK